MTQASPDMKMVVTAGTQSPDSLTPDDAAFAGGDGAIGTGTKESVAHNDGAAVNSRCPAPTGVSGIVFIAERGAFRGAAYRFATGCGVNIRIGVAGVTDNVSAGITP